MPPLSLNLASPFPKSPPPLPKTWLLLSHSSAAPFPKPCPLKARNSFPDSRREDPFHMAGRIPQWREDLPPPAGRPSGQLGGKTFHLRREDPPDKADNLRTTGGQLGLSRTHSRTTAPPFPEPIPEQLPRPPGQLRATPGNCGQLQATPGNSGQDFGKRGAWCWERGCEVLGNGVGDGGKGGARFWEGGQHFGKGEACVGKGFGKGVCGKLHRL